MSWYNPFKKESKPDPELVEVFTELREVNVRIRSERTVENYLRSIRTLGIVCGHEPKVSDLDRRRGGRIVQSVLRAAGLHREDSGE